LARVLRVAFESAEEFQREYADNLVKGGVFVPTRDRFELRESVKVVLSLDFCGEKLALGAEVVHLVTTDVAAAGATAGVALQFDGATHAVRKMLEPLRRAAGAPEHQQRDEGRRRSPRMDARVAARIDGGDEIIPGHTRDVSQTGALVAVPGKGVAVGERVSVALTHPITDEVMEVDAVVAREVESEAGVMALGLDFSPPDHQREALASFVDSIQRTEHARRLGGIRGDIAELGIQHLLQMFTTSARSGTLTVRRGNDEGLIGFENSLLRYVKLGPATGMKAMARLLEWKQGAFEFHAELDAVEETEAPLPVEAALFEAVRLQDELQRVDVGRFPDSGQPRVVAEPGEELGKLETAVLDLARVGFPVRRILEVIPEPDAEIYAALEILTDRGVLQL
jgi:Tfp pilus assembly protein PilZ